MARYMRSTGSWRVVRAFTSVHDLAEPDAFESDAEVEEFVADLYASRRANFGWASSSWIPIPTSPHEASPSTRACS